MTSSHVVIGAHKWATYHNPMGDGAAAVLYGFTIPIHGDASLAVYLAAPGAWLDVLSDEVVNACRYTDTFRRHAVDHD